MMNSHHYYETLSKRPKLPFIYFLDKRNAVNFTELHIENMLPKNTNSFKSWKPSEIVKSLPKQHMFVTIFWEIQ